MKNFEIRPVRLVAAPAPVGAAPLGPGYYPLAPMNPVLDYVDVHRSRRMFLI